MKKRENLKAELLATLKSWEEGDPKLLWLWSTEGAFVARKILFKANEWLILTEGMAYRDGKLFQITHPIPVEIATLNDFALRYEMAGRLCEDEYHGWWLFEEYYRDKQGKEFMKTGNKPKRKKVA